MTRKLSPEAEGREQAAREIIAGMADLSKVDLFRLQWATRVNFLRLERFVLDERLGRGDLTIYDLTPSQRRELIDASAIDVHALAARPIMQPDKLYLPAGRLSMEETRAREAAQLHAGGPHDR